MKKNRVLSNNATGETLTMLVSEEENSGACQLYEVCLPPHRPSPPLHYRVDFIETFTVKRRQLHIYVDRDPETSAAFARRPCDRVYPAAT
jgi:hypothetical protein